MIIKNDDPALRFLKCYDSQNERLRVSAFDLKIKMGYWDGSAIPVSHYEFVATTADVLEALQEYLGPFAKAAYLKGHKPKKKKRPAARAPGINPGPAIQYQDFVRVGDE